MADEKIVISAIARVVDLASAPLKAIQKVITGVSEAAKKTGTAVGEMGAKVGGAFAGVAGRVSTATGKVAGFARSMGGLLGPVSALVGLAGIGGLTAGMKDFVEASKGIQGAATRLGVSTEMVQTFYEVFGGNAEKANDAMGFLQKSLANIAKGGKEVQPVIAVLQKMGVTMAEIKAGDVGKILPKIMEGFKKNENPIMRTAVAMALFGKGGQDYINFLIKGAAGFRSAAEEAKEFGLTLEEIERGTKLGVSMKNLGNIVESVSRKISAAISVTFGPLIDWFTEFIKANRQLLAQIALPAFIGAITAAVVGLGIAVAAALGPWVLLIGAITAGAVAIAQNWGDIITWLDKEIPGLTDTVSKAASDLWAFAKQAGQNISKGFTEGGLAGAWVAYVTTFKDAWVGIAEWLVGIFQQINWGEVGRGAAAIMAQAFIALFQGTVSLGQFIIAQFNTAVEYLRTLDWAEVGRTVGTLFVQAWIATFKALWDINLWAAGLVAQLGSAMASADWSAIIKSIALFFVQLQLDMLRIGKDLIVGLIEGMVSAIPGLQVIVDKIKGMFGGIGSWLKSAGSSIASAAGESVSRLGTGLTPLNPFGNPFATPNLLQQSAAGPQKSEVTTTINVNAPPGSTVTSSQTTSGAPIDSGVNVGAATWASGVP
jgi:hypothetical protein